MRVNDNSSAAYLYSPKGSAATGETGSGGGFDALLGDVLKSSRTDATTWTTDPTTGVRVGSEMTVDGITVRPVVAPGPPTRGGSCYVGEDGTFYTKAALPGAKLQETAAPSWWQDYVKAHPAAETDDEAEETGQAFEWGDWEQIDGAWYREVVPPTGKVEGMTFYADEKGNLSLKVGDAEDAKLVSIDRPDWYAEGTTPGKNPDEWTASWGDWRKVDGKWVREIEPPFDVDGIEFFADEEGGFYFRPSFAKAELTSAKLPEWLGTELDPGPAPGSEVEGTASA